MYHEFKLGDRVAFTRTFGSLIWDHDGEPMEPETFCYIGTLVNKIKSAVIGEGEGSSWTVRLEDDIKSTQDVWEAELIPVPHEASEEQIKALKRLLTTD